jgi:hypothetical protein
MYRFIQLPSIYFNTNNLEDLVLKFGDVSLGNSQRFKDTTIFRNIENYTPKGTGIKQFFILLA